MVVAADTGAGHARRTSHAGRTGHASCAAESAAHRFWFTLKTVVTLLAAGETTTLLLEVGHADGRESGGGVVLGLILVDLVDGNGGVDNRRLDGLLLDDWLDGPDTVLIQRASDARSGW